MSDLSKKTDEFLHGYWEAMLEIHTMAGDIKRQSDAKHTSLPKSFLISVPLIPRPTKSVRANVSFDQGLLAAIDAAADQLDLNRSAFLAMAARNEITRQDCAA